MDDNMDDVENTVVEGEAEEVEIRFPIRLYSKGLEPPAQKSINYHCCDTGLFPTLEGVLKADEWMELCNSPVGVCLKFYKLDFGWASRLVHCILTWQLQCEKKYEIWSLVNETPVRFSLLEFHHLTGLNCDYIENIEQPECEITEEMKGFWRKLGVSIEKGPSVEELIAACHVCETWSREDRIRLGFLAIYVNFFEGVGRRSATKVLMARLVMDRERFENYPWGRVAFKKLIRSVKEKDLSRSSYTIEGFVQVLQCWIYYALPDVGSEFGDPLPNNPTPMILSFQGSRNRKYVKEAMMRQERFNNFLSKDTYDEMWPRWDDEVEDIKTENIVRAFYGDFGRWRWKEYNWPDEGSLAVNIVKVEDGQKVENGEPSQRAQLDVPIGKEELKDMFQSVKDHIDDALAILTEKLFERVQGCETKVHSLSKKVSATEKMVRSMEDTVKGVLNKGGEKEKVTEKAKEAEDEQPGDKEKKEDAPPEEALDKAAGLNSDVDGSNSVNGEEASVYVVTAQDAGDHSFVIKKRQSTQQKAALVMKRAKSDRLRKLTATQNSPFLGDKTAKTIIPNNKHVGRGYDPFDKVDNQKIKVLDDWLRIDTECPPETAKSSVAWFDTLRSPTKWLNDSHIDAGMNLLRLRYGKHPEWFRSDRICFLDSLFQRLWTAKYVEFVNSPANADGTGKWLPPGSFDYHSGDLPAYCKSGKTWGLEVDDIYSPLHVLGNHWVALWISIPRRHVVVWDSDVYHAKEMDIFIALKPFTVMFPYLLNALALADEKEKYPRSEFTYERMKGPSVPRNKQSGDCGVFALKYIECHALGMPFPSALCDKNIKAIREKLAAEIFDETGLQGTEQVNYDMLGIYDE